MLCRRGPGSDILLSGRVDYENWSFCMVCRSNAEETWYLSGIEVNISKGMLVDLEGKISC